ncbi:hypothetical protein K435DRAFT_808296 [Dendrothele bispora CBS 962.96]|uniref:Uncharacterized protein n=1 Tax=Dendrothele bispora (strain CBS 962.96) TaxID=1314807 RepID=A0A4S8L1Y9_DENBC|nr:hypothetical protein K435DRAFT_808296 [Dendrothele bispora CBS 962.96]
MSTNDQAAQTGTLDSEFSSQVRNGINGINDRLDNLEVPLVDLMDLKEAIRELCRSFSGRVLSPEGSNVSRDLWEIFQGGITRINTASATYQGLKGACTTSQLHRIDTALDRLPSTGIIDSAIATASQVHLNDNRPGDQSVLAPLFILIRRNKDSIPGIAIKMLLLYGTTTLFLK